MRILAFVLAVVLSTAIALGSAVLFVFAAPHMTPTPQLVGSLGLALAILGPIMLGSFLAAWGGRHAEPETQRLLRRSFIGVLCIQAAALVAIVIGALLAHAAVWFAPSMVALVVVMTASAIPLGLALRRYGLRHPEPPLTEFDLSRAAQLTRVRRIVLVFCAGVVAGILLMVVLQQSHPHRPRELAISVVYAVFFGCLAGAITTVVTSLALGRRMREVVGGDLGALRRIARVVVKGKSEPLSEQDLPRASRYAAYAALFYRYQIAYFALLYAGLVGEQFAQVLSGISTFGIYLGVLLVALFFVLLPLFIRQMRRASRYAAQHPMQPVEHPTANA